MKLPTRSSMGWAGFIVPMILALYSFPDASAIGSFPNAPAVSQSQPLISSPKANVFPSQTLSGATVTNQCTVVGKAGMIWESSTSMEGIRDNGDNDTRSYEHELNWNDRYRQYVALGKLRGLANNIPNYYTDTLLDARPGGPISIAGGSWRSKLLSPGVYYHWDVEWTDPGAEPGSLYTCYPGPPTSTPLIVGAQRSLHGGACLFSYANCVAGSRPGYPTHVHPTLDGFQLNGLNYSYDSNKVINGSFEDAISPWLTWTSSGVVQIARYTGGISGSQFVEFNCALGATGCKLYQNISLTPWVSADDIWHVSVYLKCPGTGSTCPAGIALVGTGAGSDERTTLSVDVPLDGVYHQYTFQAVKFATHTAFAIEIVNKMATRNLDVDYAFAHRTDYEELVKT